MEDLREIWRGFIYGRFYISFAALLLTCASSLLFTGAFPDGMTCIFVYCSTLFTYNLYYIQYPSPLFSYHKEVSIAAFLIAVFCFIQMPGNHLPLYAGIGVLSMIYILQKWMTLRIFRYPFTKILILTSVWVLTVCLIPLQDHIPHHPGFVLYCLYQFIFIFILNYIFDLKDIETDIRIQKHSLATFLGREKSHRVLILCSGILVLNAIALYFFLPLNYSIALTANALICLVVVLKLQYLKNLYQYLLYIDGLMILEVLLLLISIYIKPLLGRIPF